MSLYKFGISDKTMGAMQNSDPEIQKMMLESQQNNTEENESGIMRFLQELFGFGSAGASDFGAIANNDMIQAILNPETPKSEITFLESMKRGPIEKDQPYPPVFFPNNQQDSLKIDMGATGTIPKLDNTGILSTNIVNNPVPFGTSVDNFQGFTDKKARDREEDQNFLSQLLEFFGSGGVMGNVIKKGLNFFQNRPSQLAYDNLINQGYGPQLQNIYGTGGIMQGYNPVSAFGKGPIESMRDRRNKILGRMLTDRSYSQTNLDKLNRAITSVGGDGGVTAADLSNIGRKQFTGPGKAFAPRKDTATAGKTVQSSSTPGGFYSSPK